MSKRLTVGQLRKEMEGLPDDAPVYVALASGEEMWTGIAKTYAAFPGIEGWEGSEVDDGPNLAITTADDALLARPLLAKLKTMADSVPRWKHDNDVRDGILRAIKAIEAELQP